MQIILVVASLCLYFTMVLAVMMFNMASWLQFVVLVVMPSLIYGSLTYWFIQFKRRKKKKVKPIIVPPTLTKEIAYQLLGVPPNASEEEIHQAYITLMHLAHPDKGGPVHLAKLINEAKAVIMSHK